MSAQKCPNQDNLTMQPGCVNIGGDAENNAFVSTPSRQSEKRLRTKTNDNSSQPGSVSDSVGILLARMDEHAAVARQDLARSIEIAKRDHEMLVSALGQTNGRVTLLDDRLNQVENVARVQKDELQIWKDIQEDEHTRRDRLRDVIISGVPLTGREVASDLRSIVVHIGQFVGVPFTPIDIVHVFKTIPKLSRGLDSMLVVRFGSIGVRAAFFNRYMGVKGGLNASALGYKSNTRIYVSDNLTPRNTAIRSHAVILKKNNRIAGHTVRDGLVCVTLMGENKKRIVKSIQELNGLINTSANSIEAMQTHVQPGPRSETSVLARAISGVTISTAAGPSNAPNTCK